MLQTIRNIRFWGSALALAALGVVSCTREIGSPEMVERASLTIRLTVPQSVERATNSPRTYAGTEPGYGRENRIESLYVTFYSRSEKENGLNAPWTKVYVATLSGDDIPDFTDTTQGNPTAIFTVEGIPVTTTALEAGTQLKAVIYANAASAPVVASESDFWEGTGDAERLKPLFFTGEGEFSGSGDAWKANVSLTRQVAKLRIRAGIHPDAVPATLRIVPQSIGVEVEHMADRSSTMDDPSLDPGAAFDPATVTYFDRKGAALRMETDWTEGLKIDSLYMHPHDAGTDPDLATVVRVSMKVEDPVSAESQTLTLEYPLGKASADGSGQKDYTIKRNTIYTLDIQVQSIEGESTNVELDIRDWDDATVDIDTPWGEVAASHSVLYVLPGEVSEAVSVAAGGGLQPYSVSLVKPDKSGPLEASVAELLRDGAPVAGNAFLLDPGSKVEVKLAAAAQFAGAWLKIVKTHDGQAGGLARYIPVGKLELSVTGNGSVPYTGGTLSLPVVSRATMPDGTTRQMDWSARLVDENGAPAQCDWVTVSDPTTDGSSIEVDVAPQIKKGMTPRPVVSGYDLSTRGGQTSVNTANCYIVNASGTYSLPLVYGNAIVGGQPNASAYTSTASGTNVVNPFVNHTGAGITDPYIYNNGISVADAKLLWQDVDGMIDESSVELSADKRHLTFRVTDRIDYGNAVLAVFDDAGAIAWSWHIWATDYDPYGADGTRTVQNRTAPNREFDFMLHSLGWCPDAHYEARSQRLLLTQTDTGASIVVPVEQTQGSTLGNNTYYQWGRKDPFPGLLSNSSNKPTYGPTEYIWPSTGSTSGDQTVAGQDIKEYIKYPYKFCSTQVTTEAYLNLWSANNNVLSLNTNKPVKTVYDPSPAGFVVPPGGAYTGFTTTGGNSSSDSQFNVSGQFNSGWNFYCNSDGTGETIFFPASGCRNYTITSGAYFGSGGFYWTSGSTTIPIAGGGAMRRYDLGFRQTYLYPQQVYYCGFGFSVRPVKE